MGRRAGTKNRNYPALTLEQALEVATVIQDEASGMVTKRLTLAQLMDRSPSSSDFRELIFASRAYGLTTGGINSDEFDLTQLGREATGADEVAMQAARKKAVLNIEPFRTFLTAYNGKKVPSQAPLAEYLISSAGVPSERVTDCIEHILADARSTGLFRNVKGSEYVDLEMAGGGSSAGAETDQDEEPTGDEDTTADTPIAPSVDGAAASAAPPAKEPPPVAPSAPKKVFVAHGKNRTPLEQLKKVLDKFKVKYAVAIDEPNKGRPVSTKVANLMRDECSSAIFIFTADERFLREEKDGSQVEVWRPSENVVYELGAASILYDRRIVIFKESGVTFPTDFSDLGYISFEADQLEAKMGDLFSELVSLDVLEVRAKG